MGDPTWAAMLLSNISNNVADPTLAHLCQDWAYGVVLACGGRITVAVCPSHVQSWRTYFSQVTKGAPPGTAYQAPPTLSPATPAGALVPPAGQGEFAKVVSDHLKVNSLIRSYQVRGGACMGQRVCSGCAGDGEGESVQDRGCW